MQQRRLRLGDILDDYCPRERRVTNHVVVAMIDEDVKQTRCTTCDADHEYKQAKVPPQRRKRPESGAESVEAAAHRLRAMGDQSPAHDADDLDSLGDVSSLSPADLAEDQPPTDVFETEVAESQPEELAQSAAGSDDDGPVHRRLIRATLPRPEGQVPERREPDFTMRAPGVRGREFDNGNDRGGRRPARGPGGGGGGQQGGGGQARFGGPRFGSGGGSGRSGPGQDQRQPGNRAGRPDDQRGNRSGSRGRSRKRGR